MLAILLIIALIVRVGYVSGLGFPSDLELDAGWATQIAHGGLLNVYQKQAPDYPPLYLGMLGALTTVESSHSTLYDVQRNPEFLVLLKVFPVLADLALIAVTFAFLRREKVWGWLIPALLAVWPGIWADSAWWGQTDSLLTLLLVLSLIALNRQRPVVGWLFWGVAIVMKFQAIVLLPILLILTFRRFGWQRALAGLLAAALIAGIVLGPFVATSGTKALGPYLASVDIYPQITVGAYNAWALIGQLQGSSRVPDSTAVIGPLTFKQIAFALLGLYALALVVTLWRQASRPREFVWAGGLYVAFFMLPTQIHERYLYMGMVITLIAVVQDRRLRWIAFGFLCTFAYNLLNIAQPLTFLGFTTWPRTTIWPVAIINCILFVGLTWISFAENLIPPSVLGRLMNPQDQRIFIRRAAKALALLAVIAVLTQLFAMEVESSIYRQTAAWLNDHVAGSERLTADAVAQEVISQSGQWQPGASWTWQPYPDVSRHRVGDRLAAGDHYLVLDERADVTVPLAQRIERLTAQGATLIYQSNKPLGLGAQQAVLWTFRPAFPLNVTFDGSLFLAGYNVVHGDQGVGLLFHWYTLQPPTAAYHLFIHIFDPISGQLIGQSDTQLGQGTHPSNTWRKSEIVFETDWLPPQVVLPVSSDAPAGTGGRTYRVEFGLYQFESGQRALISGGTLGAADHLEITLS